MDKSYSGALEAAGAAVHVFEQFGSYQGDWWALVTYGGTTGWVTGSYGSCPGCDAIEAEFEWDSEKCDDHKYEYVSSILEGCDDCKEKLATEEARFAAFGREYLDNILTQEEAEKTASRNLDWDSDAEKMLKFIKENARA